MSKLPSPSIALVQFELIYHEIEGEIVEIIKAHARKRDYKSLEMIGDENIISMLTSPESWHNSYPHVAAELELIESFGGTAYEHK